MENLFCLAIYHDATGLFHLASSILALIAGTLILFLNKGTKMHKQIGYVYCFAMVLVNISAFMIYRLFGGFGMFHIAAVVSSLTLIAGMVPVLFRSYFKNAIAWHYGFMYWSVMGLYGAFVSESLVRIPEQPFMQMVGIGTGIVMGLGAFFFMRYMKRWEEEFIQKILKP